MNKIILNRIQCNKCKDIITSEHVHDFKYCKCGKVAVDGGRDYLKRMGEREDWTDLSIVQNGDASIIPEDF